MKATVGGMRHRLRVSVLVAAALAVPALTACGTSDEAVPETAAPVQAASPAADRDLPTAVTGYTDEAREEMADDGLAEADVEGVLQAALDGNADVEWDDDGYFEIEFRDIEIDVDPQGLVRDADR